MVCNWKINYIILNIEEPPCNMYQITLLEPMRLIKPIGEIKEVSKDEECD